MKFVFSLFIIVALTACQNRRAEVNNSHNEFTVALGGRQVGVGQFQAGGLSLAYGEMLELTWVIDGAPDSCQISAAGSVLDITPLLESGYQSDSLTSSRTYVLTCTNSYQTKSDELVVTVAAQPTIAFEREGAASRPLGQVTIGQTADTLVRVNNIGSQTITLSATGLATPFSLVNASCLQNLAAGASCSFSIRFAPSAVGTASDVLTLAVAGSSASSTVSVSGEGMTPPSSIALDSVDGLQFGNVALGASPYLRFTARNTSAQALTLVVTGIATPFSIANATCLLALPAGQSCNFRIHFSPTAVGLATKALALTVNGSAQTVPFTVQGTGFINPADIGYSISSSGAWDFLQVGTGEEESKTFQISNTGLYPISGLTLANLAAPFFLTASNCADPIAVGGNCSFTIEFRPTAVGPAARIAHWDLGTSHRADLSLSGTGVNDSLPLDASYGVAGKFFTDEITVATHIRAQADGQLLLASIQGSTLNVLKIKENGALRTTFASGGLLAEAIPAGSTLLDVLSMDTNDFFVVFNDHRNYVQVRKYNSTGIRNNDFLMGTSAKGTAASVTSDGRVVLAFQNKLFRFQPNSLFDNSFDGDGIRILTEYPNIVIEKIAIQSDGKILLAGPSAAGSNDIVFIRLNANGSYDNTFGGSNGRALFIGSVSSTVIELSSIGTSGESIMVLSNASGGKVYRLTPQGLASVNMNVTGSIRDAVVLSSGKIGLLGFGATVSTGGKTGKAILLRADGTGDNVLDPNDVDGSPMLLGTQGDGKLIAIGPSHSGVLVGRFNP